MPSTVWKGYISFGLVSFPVRLYAAARAESVHFHLLHAKDGSRVKEVFFCQKEDKPVTRKEMVKGYETAKGKYVVIEDEDLKKIAPKTATVMAIEKFVKADEVDPLYFEKSYYVAPGEELPKPYGLLLAAMRKTDYFAVAKITMHDREHVVILRPTDEGLVAHTMFFGNEMHAASKTKVNKAKFSDKELAMAGQLIDTLAGKFDAGEYKDEYRTNVERLIKEKQKGKKITVMEAPEVAPVDDIMDALRKSLDAHKKTKKKAA